VLFLSAFEIPIEAFLHIRQRVVSACVRFVEFQGFLRREARLVVRLRKWTEFVDAGVYEGVSESRVRIRIRGIKFDCPAEPIHALQNPADVLVKKIVALKIRLVGLGVDSTRLLEPAPLLRGLTEARISQAIARATSPWSASTSVRSRSYF
jgi:hypothetical protein